jgi:hypothetical protein
MKAFEACSVYVNGDPMWQVKVTDDGLTYVPVPGAVFYRTYEECETERLRLEVLENGTP